MGRTVWGRHRHAVALALLAAACGLDIGSESTVPQARVATPLVRVAEVAPDKRPSTLRLLGRLGAVAQVEERAQVAGWVRAVHVAVGDRVRRGDVIVELDRAREQLRLIEAESEAVIAELGVAQAREAMDREEELARAGATPAETLNRVRASLQVAMAAAESARSRREAARVDLEEGVVKAAADGTVTARLVEPGERVVAGENLLVLDKAGPLRVTAFVSERDLNGLRVGATATVRTPDLERGVANGRVQAIASEQDAHTGKLRVLIALDGLYAELRPGTSVDVWIDVARREDLRVPRSAVVDRERRHLVYIVERDIAVERRVKLGPLDGEEYPLLEGLQAGERVIVQGLDWVIDGTQVRVAGPEEPSAAP